MKVLRYQDLSLGSLSAAYNKLVQQLEAEDFAGAEIKKLKPTVYYRAKLDHANRLLFTFSSYQGETYILALEIIRNHAYDHSRFLRGAMVNEEKIEKPPEMTHLETPPLSYLSPTRKTFHLLNKFISLDDSQDAIFRHHLPLILIGAAGSGKTVVTLEKMKQAIGSVLYVTQSPYLVQHAQQLYQSYRYNNEEQEVDFYSFQELLESIAIPKARASTYGDFKRFFRRHSASLRLKSPQKLYEEFKGVITGARADCPYLSEADYLGLGIKQSIYAYEERKSIYTAFTKYREFLKENGLYELNQILPEYFPKAQPRYDFIVVDELQDLTNIQLLFLIKHLKKPSQFIFCGDANQIVHPNFFSWSKVKTLLYQHLECNSPDILQILHQNFRNSRQVIAAANQILRIKQARFGAIDKESHYFMEEATSMEGRIACLVEKEAVLTELDQKTKKSTAYAVLVLHEEDKNIARKQFNTPLLFTIHEAKGLEYENVILYHFLSSEEQNFREIVKGICREDLRTGRDYARARNKEDKSLEIYKFYINALYVGITRAVKNIYWVERTLEHPLWGLLDLKALEEPLYLEKSESSRDEWQKEADKLALQGKTEQAEEIRERVLGQETVPWEVLTPVKVDALSKRFLLGETRKEESLLLLEYAIVYDHAELIEILQQSGFRPALRLAQSQKVINSKYFMPYQYSNMEPILRDIARYGVNFRDRFNRTPLMQAAFARNAKLLNGLLAQGADASLLDNQGTHAARLLLEAFLTKPKKITAEEIDLYERCAPPQFVLSYQERLFKVSTRLMEYFLFNVLFYWSVCRKRANQFVVFSAAELVRRLADLPHALLPTYRQRQSYISSILSKNEIHSRNPYNRHLFVRHHRGYYYINPDLSMRLAGEWLPITNFLREKVLESETLMSPE